MGSLNIENEPYHVNEIKRALEKRGLKFYPDGDWEIHGPHPGMDYKVYVGLAGIDCSGTIKDIWVVIYPKAVYEIEDFDKWQETHAENRIIIKH